MQDIVAKPRQILICDIGIERNMTMEKIPCTNCDALILPTTAERNNGLCAKCKQSRPRTKAQGKVGLGIGIGFLLLGVTMLCFGTYIVNRTRDAKENWPTTNGTVLKVEEGQLDYLSDQTSRGSANFNRYYYSFDYKYIVGGIAYVSDYRFEWTDNNNTDISYAREIMNTYNNGSDILVSYNPSKYKDSFVAPEFDCLDSTIWRNLLQTFGGLFILLGGYRVFRDIRLASN
jgi:hypothetical protein